MVTRQVTWLHLNGYTTGDMVTFVTFVTFLMVTFTRRVTWALGYILYTTFPLALGYICTRRVPWALDYIFDDYILYTKCDMGHNFVHFVHDV